MTSEVTIPGFSRDRLDSLRTQLQGKSSEDVLGWAAEVFGDRVTCASSFGAEDVVLIDMIARVAPGVKVFTLDTGRLNDETYEVMERIRERYGIVIESYFPERKAVEQLERAKGFFSFRESIENRKECCGIRKVEPLRRALTGMDAWVTGLRRDQSVTRSDVEVLEWDEGNGLAKVNPLIEWTNDQVWEYIRANNVPYNELHDRGFPSIGCAPCTRAIQPGEDIRAGRWWWEDPENKECGLHR